MRTVPHGRHRPCTRVAEGKGRARGKPSRASTQCRQVLSTLRLPALRRLRAGTGALAFLWAGGHTGCYRDPSRLLGRGGGAANPWTAGLRLPYLRPAVILPPSGNMQVPQAWLHGGGAGSLTRLPLWHCLALPLTCSPKPGAVLPPPRTFHFCLLLIRLQRPRGPHLLTAPSVSALAGWSSSPRFSLLSSSWAFARGRQPPESKAPQTLSALAEVAQQLVGPLDIRRPADCGARGNCQPRHRLCWHCVRGHSVGPAWPVALEAEPATRSLRLPPRARVPRWRPRLPETWSRVLLRVRRSSIEQKRLLK